MAKPTVLEVLKNVPQGVNTLDWDVEIVTPPPGLDLDPLITYRLTSTSEPTHQINPIEVGVRGVSLTFPGISNPASKEITLTFLEGADMAVVNSFVRWKDMISSRANKSQSVPWEDVTSEVILYRLDRSFRRIYFQRMYLCWCSNVTYNGAPVSEGGDLMKPEITLAFSDFDEPSALIGNSLAINNASNL